MVVMVERLERGAGDVAMVMLHNQSGNAFKQAVLGHVEPMTHIRTDGYSYNSMLHGLGPTEHGEDWRSVLQGRSAQERGHSHIVKQTFLAGHLPSVLRKGAPAALFDRVYFSI
ncbi:MAG: hypothetical protein IPM93_19035 [Candidatus Obscuribacter sp.]|nr:hypothetical protein [Candidatus Obscuribacter sp.]